VNRGSNPCRGANVQLGHPRSRLSNSEVLFLTAPHCADHRFIEHPSAGSLTNAVGAYKILYMRVVWKMKNRSAG
jgi:hypothetical protein